MLNFLKIISYKNLFVVFFFLSSIFSVKAIDEVEQTTTQEKNKNSQIIFKEKEESNFDNYILGPGDSIYIEFLNIRELSGVFEIGPSGYLYLPRIRDFLAEGLNIQELREKLTIVFKEYVKKPDIYIRPLSYRPVRVYVGGEVSKPGFYTLAGGSSQIKNSSNMELDRRVISRSASYKNNSYIFPTVFDAIQSSFGVTPYSDLSKIKVTRKISKGKGGGRKMTELDFISLLIDGNESQNIRLFDGDVVQINKSNKVLREQMLTASRSNLSPDKLIVFVSGRVKMPGTITLPQGSSLNQALIASDGPKLIRGKIEFIRFRKGGESERRVFNYSSEAPIASHKNPLLMNGDLIRVQDNILSATSTALGELTSPFIGIYSIYNFFDGVF